MKFVDLNIGDLFELQVHKDGGRKTLFQKTRQFTRVEHGDNATWIVSDMCCAALECHFGPDAEVIHVELVWEQQ